MNLYCASPIHCFRTCYDPIHPTQYLRVFNIMLMKLKGHKTALRILLMVQYQDVYTENLYLKTSLMNLTYAVLCIT